MKRDVYLDLLAWKGRLDRKPLILTGARQVGKTTVLKAFAQSCYGNSVYVNFEEDNHLKKLFKASINPRKIIRSLSLIFECDITPGETLIIFDEIQDCPDALNSLKYFNEKAPDHHIVVAGSLLGVMMGQEKGYPVGNVQTLSMFPLTFFEFLSALGRHDLRTLLEDFRIDEDIQDVLHDLLLEYLRVYFIVGGMPEVVCAYLEDKTFGKVRDIQRELLRGYRSDFSKYASPSVAQKVAMVWDSIPAQLSRENKKFAFQLVSDAARSREYYPAVKWLMDAGLVFKLENLKKPLVPMSAYKDITQYKLYFFDTGLLGALCHLEPKLSLEDEKLFRFFKGAITENYVLQELVAQGRENMAYWTSSGIAEVDFVCEYQSEIYPLEVKSGKRIKSKSMVVYREKYDPKLTAFASKNNYQFFSQHMNYPLYLVSRFPCLGVH